MSQLKTVSNEVAPNEALKVAIAASNQALQDNRDAIKGYTDTLSGMSVNSDADRIQANKALGEANRLVKELNERELDVRRKVKSFTDLRQQNLNQAIEPLANEMSRLENDVKSFTQLELEKERELKAEAKRIEEQKGLAIARTNVLKLYIVERAKEFWNKFVSVIDACQDEKAATIEYKRFSSIKFKSVQDKYDEVVISKEFMEHYPLDKFQAEYEEALAQKKTLFEGYYNSHIASLSDAQSQAEKQRIVDEQKAKEEAEVEASRKEAALLAEKVRLEAMSAASNAEVQMKGVKRTLKVVPATDIKSIPNETWHILLDHYLSEGLEEKLEFLIKAYPAREEGFKVQGLKVVEEVVNIKR